MESWSEEGGGMEGRTGEREKGEDGRGGREGGWTGEKGKCGGGPTANTITTFIHCRLRRWSVEVTWRSHWHL